MTTGSAPKCIECKHYRQPDPEVEGLRCDAFPEGIPDEIIFGDEEHDTPVEGQGNDLVFEPLAPRDKKV